MSTSSGQDPLFASLDALVREGTLTGAQAERVYQSTSAGPPGRAGTTQQAARMSPGSLLEGAVVVAGAVALAGFFVMATLASERGFEWKSFLSMVAVVVGFGALTAVAVLAMRSGAAPRPAVGVVAALAVVTLGLTLMTPFDQTWLVYISGSGDAGQARAADLGSRATWVEGCNRVISIT